MAESDKRNHFRLDFPHAERPKLVSGKFELSVIEISEGGCSVQVPESSMTAFAVAGLPVNGVIIFADGDRHEVEGEVIRVTSRNRVSIKFTKGLTFAKMMTEHRRILAKHPK
jgi:DUF917 family protein